MVIVFLLLLSISFFSAATLPAESIPYKDTHSEIYRDAVLNTQNLQKFFYDNPFQKKDSEYPPIKLEVSLDNAVPITLEEVLAQSIENNINLNIAKADSNVAKWGFWKQASDFLPDIDLSLTSQKLDGDFFLNSGVTARINESQERANIRINYRAFNGGTTAFLTWAEKYYRDAVKDNEKQQYNKTLLDSIIYYVELLREQIALSTKLKNVEYAFDDYEQARKFLEAGTGTRYDLHQAEARYARTQQELIQQESLFREKEINLSQHLNSSYDVPLKVTDVSLTKYEIIDDSLTIDDFIGIAKKNNPRIKSALANKKGAYKEALSKVGVFLPKLDLFFDYNGTGPELNALNRLNSYGFAVTYDIAQNLGGEAVTDLLQAKASAKRAKLLYEQEQMQIEKDLRLAFLNFETTKSVIIAAEKEYLAANEGVRLAKLRYNNGIDILSQLIERQKDLTESELNLIVSVAEYNIAQARLAYEMGTISLEQIIGSN